MTNDEARIEVLEAACKVMCGICEIGHKPIKDFHIPAWMHSISAGKLTVCAAEAIHDMIAALPKPEPAKWECELCKSEVEWPEMGFTAGRVNYPFHSPRVFRCCDKCCLKLWGAVNSTVHELTTEAFIGAGTLAEARKGAERNQQNANSGD